MKKIINLEESEKLAKRLKVDNKSIVLVGGCFDILHKGHLTFLGEAKKQGDTLFVALESDESVRRLKGENRPINKQGVRGENLANLASVDYVILLPVFTSNEDYASFTQKLSPNIIAITEGDPKQAEKESQGKVVVVTKHLADFSTTKILQTL